MKDCTYEGKTGQKFTLRTAISLSLILRTPAPEYRNDRGCLAFEGIKDTQKPDDVRIIQGYA